MSWLVKASGRILGPWTSEQLEEAFAAKKVVLIDEVSRPLSRWQFIREVPELAEMVEKAKKADGKNKELTGSVEATTQVTATIRVGEEILSSNEDLTPPPNFDEIPKKLPSNVIPISSASSHGWKKLDPSRIPVSNDSNGNVHKISRERSPGRNPFEYHVGDTIASSGRKKAGIINLVAVVFAVFVILLASNQFFKTRVTIDPAPKVADSLKNLRDRLIFQNQYVSVEEELKVLDRKIPTTSTERRNFWKLYVMTAIDSRLFSQAKERIDSWKSESGESIDTNYYESLLEIEQAEKPFEYNIKAQFDGYPEAKRILQFFQLSLSHEKGTSSAEVLARGSELVKQNNLYDGLFARLALFTYNLGSTDFDKYVTQKEAIFFQAPVQQSDLFLEPELIRWSHFQTIATKIVKEKSNSIIARYFQGLTFLGSHDWASLENSLKEFEMMNAAGPEYWISLKLQLLMQTSRTSEAVAIAKIYQERNWPAVSWVLKNHCRQVKDNACFETNSSRLSKFEEWKNWELQ